MQKGVRLAITVLFLSSAAAAVCGQPQPRLVCAEYFKEQVVVIAKLMHTERTPAKGRFYDGHFYTLSVQKILRGTIDQSFRVWEENSSGRAGFDWVNGRSYLLFMSFSKEDQNSWELDGCGNSAPLSKAGKALNAIERINAGQKGGFVTGSIAHDSSRSPLAGILVLVRSQEHTYQTTTTKDGTFKVRVPPDKYTVKVRRPGWLFRKDDFTYEDPRSIEIQMGSCAQIQFIGHTVP